IDGLESGRIGAQRRRRRWRASTLYRRLGLSRRLRLGLPLRLGRRLTWRWLTKTAWCRRRRRFTAPDWRREASALLRLGHGRRVGGQDFHAAVHAAIRYDQSLGTEGQANLAHGFTIGDAKETTDLHAALLPPMMAAIFSMRSSGISMLDSMPICGK